MRMGLFEFFLIIVFSVEPTLCCFSINFLRDQSCLCSPDEIFRMTDLYLARGFLMVHFQYFLFFSVPYEWLLLLVYLVQFYVWVLDVDWGKCEILSWVVSPFSKLYRMTACLSALSKENFPIALLPGAQSITIVFF